MLDHFRTRLLTPVVTRATRVWVVHKEVGLMRVPVSTYVIASALVALTLVAGCGDSNDTNIIIGDEPTPTGGVLTATPARTPTPGATTTTGAATPTTSGATPSATASGGSPAPTATPGGAVDADVQTVTADILPFLASTALLTGGSVSTVAAANAPLAVASGMTRKSVEAVKNDPCPDGGTRVDDEGVPVRTITLDACDVSAPSIGPFEFDGTVVITLTSLSGGTIDFDITATDLDTDDSVDFVGTLTLTVSSGNFVLNGPLVISTDAGDFTLNANQITIDSNRKLVSGSGSITDDDDSFDIDTIAMVIAQGGATANFTVTFDDSSVHTYTVNLQTGQITQNT